MLLTYTAINTQNMYECRVNMHTFTHAVVNYKTEFMKQIHNFTTKA